MNILKGRVLRLGNLKIYEGPNINKATKAIRKAENVSHFLGIKVVKHPTKGDEIAYVAHISPKKYPAVFSLNFISLIRCIVKNAFKEKHENHC